MPPALLSLAPPSRYTLRPQLLHNVVRDSLQPRLRGKHPRRLAQIYLPCNTETCNHLNRQIDNLPFEKGLQTSNEILEGRDDEGCWYRVFFGEGNPCNGAKSNTTFEYLSLRAVFSCFKFESMGDREEGYPFLDGHYETIIPTGKKIVRNEI